MAKSPFLPAARKKKKINVNGLSSQEVANLQRLVDETRQKATSASTSSATCAISTPTPMATTNSTPQLQQLSGSRKRTAPEETTRVLRPSNPPPAAAANTNNDTPATAPLAAVPNPPSNRVVIFDNVVGTCRKQLEPELYRVAPWLQPDAVDVMRGGGLRVKCKSPTDADRLLKRDGFPADAFHGFFTVRRPGATDPSCPISPQLERDLRSVITSRLPGHYDASDLRHLLRPDYVEVIRDIPAKDPNRPPLRVVILKTREQRDDAIANGLEFLNRRISVRPLRPPVLPPFCRRCSGLGHATVDCKCDHFICGKCTGNHATATCNVQHQDALCPNCGGHHFATYRGCPAFRAATTKEIELRQARVAAKLAKREQKFPADRRPVARSINPAPVKPGVLFAAAVTATANIRPNPSGPNPNQVSPSAELTALPTGNQVLDLLRAIKEETTATRLQMQSIKEDAAAARKKIEEMEKRLNTLAQQQQRLEERFEGVPDLDEDEAEEMDNVENTTTTTTTTTNTAPTDNEPPQWH
jgi:hypothetical protein